MKTNKIYDISLNTDHTIIASTLSKSDEVIVLMSSGDVVRFNMYNQTEEHLFSVKNNIGYSDGGFDITAKSSIYTMDEIVVVVNDYKRHGFVHYPEKYNALHLWREDYHADISAYPVALYKNADGIPHLISSEAWNHIQIMNLSTRQILTAAKSLIEENAEEKHLNFYKKHSEDNKLPWPRSYDYFYGKLLLSPNQQKFLSAGWTWGSSDNYRVYDIEKFINSNRISHLGIGIWEHENRATCWIDNNCVAIIYSPFMEGDENSTSDTPNEIHIFKIDEDQVKIHRKIQVDDQHIMNSRMYFSQAADSFIFLYDKGGLSVIAMDGQIVHRDENPKICKYNPKTGYFLATDHKTISVYELTI